MAIITNPFNYTNGTPADATQVDSSFQTIYSAFNGGIDNTNIGPAGIFASQIIPTSTTRATFGGTIGYTFATILTATVGLYVGQGAGAAPAGQVAIFTDGLNTLFRSGGSYNFQTAAGTQNAAVNVGALSASTVAFSGLAAIFAINTSATGPQTIFVPGNTNANAIYVPSGGVTAASLTSTGGVAVGGALTGATTGAFSGNVSANQYSAANGTSSSFWSAAFGGAISVGGAAASAIGDLGALAFRGGSFTGSTGTFSGTVTSANVVQATNGFTVGAAATPGAYITSAGANLVNISGNAAPVAVTLNGSLATPTAHQFYPYLASMSAGTPIAAGARIYSGTTSDTFPTGVSNFTGSVITFPAAFTTPPIIILTTNAPINTSAGYCAVQMTYNVSGGTTFTILYSTSNTLNCTLAQTVSVSYIVIGS